MHGKDRIKMVAGESFFVFMISVFFVCLFFFLTIEYMANKTKWAIINNFILIFDPSLLLTITTLLTELVGIPVLGKKDVTFLKYIIF